MTAPRAAIALVSTALFLTASCGSETASTETASAPGSTAVAAAEPTDAAVQAETESDNQLGSFAVESDTDTGATTSTTAASPSTEAPTTETPTTQAPTTEAPTTTVGGQLDVFSLQIGDCVFDSPESEVETLDAIACTDEHDLEVYALFDLPDGDFPGTAAVDAAAEEGCLDRFDAYVGIAYAESVYAFTYLTPLEGGWNNLDDREVVCLLGRIDGEPNIGSAANAGI